MTARHGNGKLRSTSLSILSVVLDVGPEQTGAENQDIPPFFDDHAAIFGQIAEKEISPS